MNRKVNGESQSGKDRQSEGKRLPEESIRDWFDQWNRVFPSAVTKKALSDSSARRMVSSLSDMTSSLRRVEALHLLERISPCAFDYVSYAAFDPVYDLILHDAQFAANTREKDRNVLRSALSRYHTFLHETSKNGGKSGVSRKAETSGETGAAEAVEAKTGTRHARKNGARKHRELTEEQILREEFEQWNMNTPAGDGNRLDEAERQDMSDILADIHAAFAIAKSPWVMSLAANAFTIGEYEVFEAFRGIVKSDPHLMNTENNANLMLFNKAATRYLQFLDETGRHKAGVTTASVAA